MQGKLFRKAIVTLVVFTCFFLSSRAHVLAWGQIGSGLWLQDFNLSGNRIGDDSQVLVLKIDPEIYDLKLLSASEHNTGSMTPQEWADKFDLLAVINASMYQVNHITSTGYMRNFAHANNPKINPKFGAFLVFNPVDDSVPRVQIVDKYHQRWVRLLHQYHTVIQNYRMISVKQENLWPKTDKQHNIGCIAMDNDGKILFIHSKKAYSVHAFNQILLSLPINIYNAMFVEGGSEASLYVNIKKLSTERPEFDIDWSRYDLSHDLSAIPNVIGVIRR